MSLFTDALNRKNTSRPPVWFMRQAGRYHSQYQELKKTHSFLDLCLKPEVACEATMGPIRDFDFDAAILFSDLLFPLEAMGMGLTYEVGPKLSWHLQDKVQLKDLHGGEERAKHMAFQGEAMRLIRAALPASKGLLGFVGGPLTLYCYAVEGSHKGGLEDSKRGLTDGRYDGFVEKLVDLLAENMAIQARAGADTIAVLDTCAGDFAPGVYRERIVPVLREVLRKFKSKCPDMPVVYYSKGTGPDHWRALDGLPIAGLGIDWHHNIADVLDRWTDQYAIQGNVDPDWLFLDPKELETRLRKVFSEVLALPQDKRRGWICGLGHGVLPKTPESNVRLFLKLQREMFGETRS